MFFPLGVIKKKKKTLLFITISSPVALTLRSWLWLCALVISVPQLEKSSQPSTVITIHPHTQQECTMQMWKLGEEDCWGQYGVWLLQLKGKGLHTQTLRGPIDSRNIWGYSLQRWKILRLVFKQVEMCDITRLHHIMIPYPSKSSFSWMVPTGCV